MRHRSWATLTLATLFILGLSARAAPPVAPGPPDPPGGPNDLRRVFWYWEPSPSRPIPPGAPFDRWHWQNRDTFRADPFNHPDLEGLGGLLPLNPPPGYTREQFQDMLLYAFRARSPYRRHFADWSLARSGGLHLDSFGPDNGYLEHEPGDLKVGFRYAPRYLLGRPIPVVNEGPPRARGQPGSGAPAGESLAFRPRPPARASTLPDFHREEILAKQRAGRPLTAAETARLGAAAPRARPARRLPGGRLPF